MWRRRRCLSDDCSHFLIFFFQMIRPILRKSAEHSQFNTCQPFSLFSFILSFHPFSLLLASVVLCSLIGLFFHPCPFSSPLYDSAFRLLVHSPFPLTPPPPSNPSPSFSIFFSSLLLCLRFCLDKCSISFCRAFCSPTNFFQLNCNQTPAPGAPPKSLANSSIAILLLLLLLLLLFHKHAHTLINFTFHFFFCNPFKILSKTFALIVIIHCPLTRPASLYMNGRFIQRCISWLFTLRCQTCINVASLLHYSPLMDPFQSEAVIQANYSSD